MMREFSFPDGKKWCFNTTLIPQDGCVFIELARFRIAWRFEFQQQATTLTMQHRGYVLYVFNRCVPLPGLALLIGKPCGQETTLDAHSFSMQVYLNHPIFGRLFAYQGQFRIASSHD